MPHTRSPPFRRRTQWPHLQWLWLLTIISSLCLPWTNAQAQDKTAADYFVHSLPGAPEDTPLRNMYAGHIEITPEHHGNMFFWLYKNRHLADRPRLVIWLNGGPGCSSMDGALMEIGPYRVKEDGTLRELEKGGGWDEFANVLFVDNPVGTGFSFVDGDSYVHELDEMAEQMMRFLEMWFELFPEHLHDDIYIAGESYAGQHIPYIAKAILARNANASPRPRFQWNLTGLLIGNGWISPSDQYISYIPFLYESGLLQSGSEADRNARDQEKQCLKALEEGGSEHISTSMCEMIMRSLGRDLTGDQCFNYYDVRLTDSWPSCGMNWPPDLTQMTPYLRRQDVLRALHIDPDKKTGWTECSGQVTSAFTAQTSKPAMEMLPDLIEQVPIILFAGDKDFICNHLGIENLISNLDFSSSDGGRRETGMQGAPARPWTLDNEPAGTWQNRGNLTYIRFYNSSHMVPFDYPRRARDMLDRFMGVDKRDLGLPFDSHIEGIDADKVEQEPPPDAIDDITGGADSPLDIPAVGDGAGHDNADGDANLDIDEDEEKAKLDAATWAAYQRSGEAALVVVLIAAILWGFFVCRDRRRRRKGYLGVFNSDPYDDDGRASAGLVSRGRERSDIEAAADFDEAELDELNSNGHLRKEDRFGLAEDEESEDERRAPERKVNGGPAFKKA